MPSYSVVSQMSSSVPSGCKTIAAKNETTMKSRKILLTNLLKTLLVEWGPDEVRLALEKLITQSEGEVREGYQAARSQSERIDRPTAIDLVNRLELEDERRRPLSILAARFDDKDFLPATADVREFIIMAGERPPTMKNRQDSFRSLLDILLRLSPERLQQVAEAASHAGPAQLGPISDAIAAAGERIPRRNHDPDR